MGLFWEIMYVLVTLLCTAVLPFAIFYYEVQSVHASASGLPYMCVLSIYCLGDGCIHVHTKTPRPPQQTRI